MYIYLRRQVFLKSNNITGIHPIHHYTNEEYHMFYKNTHAHTHTHTHTHIHSHIHTHTHTSCV